MSQPHLPLGPQLLPSGVVVARLEPDAAPLPPRVQARLAEAFHDGTGTGLLHLATAETTTDLPPAWSWLRGWGQQYLATACRRSDLAACWATLDLPVPDDIQGICDRAPPFTGRELLRPHTLVAWWSAIAAAFREEATRFSGSVHDWFAERGPTWHAVGRVCFHVAENKREQAAPFAFLATYAARVGADGKPQHVPLGRALKQARGDRSALDTLLEPVRRAAAQVPLVAELVEQRALFRPQRWGPAQTARFLAAIPTMEAAGLVVRVPRWWATGKTRSVQVQVTVGPHQSSQLSTDALMAFDVHLALDGEPLDPAERATLLSTTEGLVLLRGQWVSVDADALQGVLARWEAAQAAADTTGVSFVQGMRLLAGMPGAGMPDLADDRTARWSEVVAGPSMQAMLDDIRSARDTPAADRVLGLQATLRSYQARGVAWLHTLTELGLGACLADDMGLGKTVQVLALLLRTRQVDDRPPSLLVLPTSLIPNWLAEAQRFAPSLHITVAHSSAGRDAAQATLYTRGRLWQGADAVLTTYGMLHRDDRLAETTWDLVVYDEAQALKTPSTRRARAARTIRGRARVILTGTPVENRVGDLWALFDLINPGLLGTAKEFLAFVKALGDDYGPLRRLVSPYLLRRLKTDPEVAPELPDKTEVTVFCGLKARQAALYAATVDQLARTLEQDATDQARRGAVLAALTRFKLLCDHPALVAEDPDEAGFVEGHSGKLQALATLCAELAARQDKVLVFTQYRRMMAPLADTLSRAFGRAGLELHGGTPVAERARRVDAFQAPDGPPFFVLSLRAAGTGLNLTAANHVIHFDRWWNPAVENQATDRAYRIGQQRNVLVHRFVCRGTVEERIDRLIADKAALADDIIGSAPAGPGITELDDRALLDLVRLDLHASRTSLAP